MRAYPSEENIIQNLKDAGCGEDTIQAFIEDLQTGKELKGTKLLQKHRCDLLSDLHKSQKQIDCLDHLLFILREEKGK